MFLDVNVLKGIEVYKLALSGKPRVRRCDMLSPEGKLCKMKLVHCIMVLTGTWEG